MLKETIQKTYDYEQFTFEEWNRELDRKNLARINKKVEQEGWRKIPILVDTTGRVYDGQHRLQYAKEHNLPIYYTVINGLEKKDCQIMNTTQKKWEAKDYIHYYSKLGNENYKRLATLCEEFNFLPASIIVASIKARGYGGHDQENVKNGKLIITEREAKKAHEKLAYYRRVEPYLKLIKGKTSQLYNAIGFCYDLPEIDNERLYKTIRERIKTIAPPANLEWALKGLEEIYNWHVKKQDQVYIYTEYKKQIATQKSRLFRTHECR